ncbi:MAG: hypothetical protein JXR48_06870 [Candidatus Delongbacteria bacterium]|nr:hypothetical protein [Candidatus Delongbacteria bacterium]MBN2834673.1 hypothetical protein [Candidatus Delongbacteria bacterium]
MRILTLLLTLAVTVSLFAKMETYDRKSISVFNYSVSKSASENITLDEVKRGQKKLMSKLVDLGRFDFNPIPAGIDDMEVLFSKVKEYAQANIEERAARQWEIKNDYYGTNFVTGENVDKIINGAYIFFPKVSKFTVTYDEKKKEYICNLSVDMDIYGAKEGSSEKDWNPYKLTSVNASGTNYSLLTGGSTKRNDAVDIAFDGMYEFLIKEIKKVEEFKIKTQLTVSDPKNDKMTLGMGKKVGGIKTDDAYLVGFYQKSGDKQKFVETGYMRVRNVRENDSEAQLLIVTNPKNVKENELYTEYDQIIEYPKVGLNIILSGGINGFNGYANEEAEDGGDQETYSIAGTLSLTTEYGLGRTTGLSELYAVANIEYMLLEELDAENSFSSLEEKFTGLIYELGFRKKFYSRQNAFLFGLSGTYYTLTTDRGSDYEEPSEDLYPDWFTENCYSIGGKIEVGFERLLTKDVLLQVTAGYRIMSNLTNDFGNEVFEDDTSDNGKDFTDDKYYTPNGLVAKLAIGFNL